jgi:hypothetical protein
VVEGQDEKHVEDDRICQKHPDPDPDPIHIGLKAPLLEHCIAQSRACAVGAVGNVPAVRLELVHPKCILRVGQGGQPVRPDPPGVNVLCKRE